MFGKLIHQIFIAVESLTCSSALSLDLTRLAAFLSNTRSVFVFISDICDISYSSCSLGLALYPTDWAVENFSVDREAGGNVKLVDLENIVRFTFH